MTVEVTAGPAPLSHVKAANPVGAFLAAPQATMEREWKADLVRKHGITFRSADRTEQHADQSVSRVAARSRQPAPFRGQP
jgi:hypothetical protein